MVSVGRVDQPLPEEALHNMAQLCAFAGRVGWNEHMPGEATVLSLGESFGFRRVLQMHELAPQIPQTVNEGLQRKAWMLQPGTVVDARRIAAPKSTQNASGKWKPQTEPRQKRHPWCFDKRATSVWMPTRAGCTRCCTAQ